MVIIGKRKWEEIQKQIKELKEAIDRVNTLAGIQSIKKGIKKANVEEQWMLGEKHESNE